MRCNKHLTDLSGGIGVCASCLRERLFALIAAQAQEDRRRSDSHPPPLVFPHSVSPYVSRRKSDNDDWNHHQGLSDQRFYSTPQLGPGGAIITARAYKKKQSKFSLFSSLFKSKSEVTDLDHTVSVSNSRDSSSSPSWFSSILSGRRKKQSKLFSLDESTAAGGWRPCRNRDRGMTPGRHSEAAENEECYEATSGYSSESSQGWKQTPRRAASTARRRGGRHSHAPNMSGLTFGLSPLVRASPNRQWNQRGITQEIPFSGEIRVPAMPQLSGAASCRANRSRKLADFGRLNHN